MIVEIPAYQISVGTKTQNLLNRVAHSTDTVGVCNEMEKVIYYVTRMHARHVLPHHPPQQTPTNLPFSSRSHAAPHLASRTAVNCWVGSDVAESSKRNAEIGSTRPCRNWNGWSRVPTKSRARPSWKRPKSSSWPSITWSNCTLEVGSSPHNNQNMIKNIIFSKEVVSIFSHKMKS